MKRRVFLTAVGLAAVAGCSELDEGTGGESPTSTTTSSAVPTTTGTPSTRETTVTTSTTTDPTEASTSTTTETTETTSTTTETTETTTTETPAPASFEVTEIDLPERAEINEEFQINITVRNTGGSEGTFSSTVSGTSTESSTWSDSGSIELDIPAGRNATYTSNILTYPYMSKLTYRIDETGQEFSVQIVSAKRAFGEPFTSQDDIRFSVQRVEFQETYVWEGGSGNRYEETAPSGKKFAFVYVRAENVGGQPERSPFSGDVVVLSGNQQFENGIFYKDEGKYQPAELHPGVVREGWIGFEVPEEVDVSTISVVWSETIRGDFAVYWTQSGN